MGGYGQSIAAAFWCSFLHTLFPCSSMGSCPWAAVTAEGCSIPDNSCASASFKVYPVALVQDPPEGGVWISAPSWSSMSCRAIPAPPSFLCGLQGNLLSPQGWQSCFSQFPSSLPGSILPFLTQASPEVSPS